MRASTRRDVPWHRRAARGVGLALALCLAVFAVGAVMSVLFVLAMG